jgi:hypothetical protein
VATASSSTPNNGEKKETWREKQERIERERQEQQQREKEAKMKKIQEEIPALANYSAPPPDTTPVKGKAKVVMDD